jgi:hypothetical protein
MIKLITEHSEEKKITIIFDYIVYNLSTNLFISNIRPNCLEVTLNVDNLDVTVSSLGKDEFSFMMDIRCDEMETLFEKLKEPENLSAFISKFQTTFNNFVIDYIDFEINNYVNYAKISSLKRIRDFIMKESNAVVKCRKVYNGAVYEDFN